MQKGGHPLGQESHDFSIPRRGGTASRCDSSTPCEHSLTEHLGSNQSVSFSRCLNCGAVLVIDNGRAWVIPAKRDTLVGK
jgi:hypothetical protein